MLEIVNGQKVAAITTRVSSGSLYRTLDLPRATESVPLWHVSPLIDFTAYHFSWLWILVPLLLVGGDRFTGNLNLYVLVLTVNFVHRHFGFPYAYLDREVFSLNVRRLTLFPGLMVLIFLASPVLDKTVVEIREVNFPLTNVILGAAFIALLWNFWHVYMQKYGILRLYQGKTNVPTDRRVPPWVDRLFTFGWIPLFLTYLGPGSRDLIQQRGPSVQAFILPIVDLVARMQTFLLGLSVVILLFSLGLFLKYEWRANRFRNRARLSMAAGMSLLSGAFLVVDPVKAYLAFAFSHAIEYMVFVSAFQRRRYSTPPHHLSLLGQVLRRPVAAYSVFTGVLAGVFFVSKYWEWVFPNQPHILIAGASPEDWIFYWAIYGSLIHFYCDGFLWKLRRPDIQKSV